MKVGALIFATVIGYALASPALVWKNEKEASSSTVYSSNYVKVANVVADAVQGAKSSSLAAAVFVLGRKDDGTETLSALAGSGALPNIASKHDSAAVYHSHVADVRSGFAVANDSRENTGLSALQVSLNEFSRKLTSIEENKAFGAAEFMVDETGIPTAVQKEANKRARALESADIVVIEVPHFIEPSKIDDAVTKAIEHKSVNSVILTSVRSTKEIRDEREKEDFRRFKIMERAGRSISKGRRLEQQQDDDNEGDSNSAEGVYFISMTPNIFAGLFFGLFFAVVTYTGLNCMGMIAVQDVFVHKMPTIGRES